MAAKTSTSERMSNTMLQLARRKGRLPALITALAIGAYLLVKQVLFSLLGWFVGSGLAAVTPQPGGSTSGLYELDSHAGLYLGQIPAQALATVLPFCLGVFLGLWLIAPLAEQLTLAFVLTRGALAAAAGGILVLVVNFFLALFAAISPMRFDVQEFLQGSINAVSSGAGMFIAELIAVLFASVLLWFWLKEHPREYTVSGLIDEV